MEGAGGARALGVAALTAPLPQVTVHKGDQCQLVGLVQPNHWKVASSSGSEAAVPSVCFLVPPPNPEAQEAVARWVARVWPPGRAAGVGVPGAADRTPDLPGWRPSTRRWSRCGTSCTWT